MVSVTESGKIVYARGGYLVKLFCKTVYIQPRKMFGYGYS